MPCITDQMEYEEGFKPRPYYCSEGYPTVGYGFKIGSKGDPLPSFYLPRAAADVWLTELLAGTRAEMQKVPTIAAALTGCAGNAAREAVLISMAYQLGVPGLTKFAKTLALCAAGNWGLVAIEMLNSLWARQTPKRAARHAEQMRTGEFNQAYGASV